jgi:YesN/AraC family two-component response regulator
MLSETLQAHLPPAVIVTEAQNGIETEQKIIEYSPDIIFMDVRLPEKNGILLTKEIKAVHPEISIVIITAYDSLEYRKKAFEYGADYFFAKDSLRSSDLVNLVLSVLSEKGKTAFKERGNGNLSDTLFC